MVRESNFLNISLGLGSLTSNANPGSLIINRLKKGKPQNMVPVGMGHEQGILKTFFRHELFTQSSNAGTGINDKYIIILAANFQAGRVAAIFRIFLT